jgi:hypothetical protein
MSVHLAQRVLACLAFACGFCSAAEPPREVHGMADVFAAPGVALAWGVLRGAVDATTMVIVRIATDPQQYPYGAVIGSDPFTRSEEPLLAGTRIAGSIDLRVPRAHFADFPRTELRLYGSEAALVSANPALVVFYLGVPDTTPEFADAAKLDAYLADRIGRVRERMGSKAP